MLKILKNKINLEKPRNLESFLPSFLQSPIVFLLAEHLGKDVDQPKNLAKSVTVE
jgi:glucosamine 6-phosphate synthetase-like amidotransferase/phosphosugar isomerase protein